MELFTPIPIQPIQHGLAKSQNINLSIARLDSVHPVVSGNKFFKLKHYLRKALEANKTQIITFGGFYSNHIAAAAYAAKAMGLKATGIIKGMEPAVLPHTLKEAIAQGMELQFVNSQQYNAQKRTYPPVNTDSIIIPEGGYGAEGAQGISEMIEALQQINRYDYVITAVGTGTTLAGIINAALPAQKIIGVSSMKNNAALEDEVRLLLQQKKHAVSWEISHDFSFGGYAKKTPELIDFMNRFHQEHTIPLDFVYTGKLMYAVFEWLKLGYFKPSSNVLAIHSGGLQGNLSLAAGTLMY